MGNCFTDLLDENDNYYGNCVISLNNFIFKSGDYIEGKIYLKLDSDFPHNEIFLLFQCIEEFKYFIPDNKTNDPNIDNYNNLKAIYENNLKYNNIYKIKTFKEKEVKKGEYLFPFKIKLIDYLLPTYNFKYFVDIKKSYSKIKYFLMAGLVKNKDLNTSLLSNKTEIFIDSPIIINQVYKSMAFMSKGCSNLLSLKGDLIKLTDDNNTPSHIIQAPPNNSNKKNKKKQPVLTQSNLIITANKYYEFKLLLNNSNSKVNIDIIKVNLISRMNIIKNNEIICLEERTIFETYLGKLLSGKDQNFKFRISETVLDSNIPSVKSDYLEHHYYFKIDLVNNKYDISNYLKFPIIVKNSIINKIKLDKKFLYYRGNISPFNSKFNPLIENIIDLTNSNYVRNDYLLIKNEELEMN